MANEPPGSNAQETDASKPLRLVGSHEIRLMLGVQRSRVYQITHKSSFPEPVAELEAGKVWLEEEVREWIEARRKEREKAELKVCKNCPYSLPVRPPTVGYIAQ
jgi:prophage regulatory protein